MVYQNDTINGAGTAVLEKPGYEKEDQGGYALGQLKPDLIVPESVAKSLGVVMPPKYDPKETAQRVLALGKLEITADKYMQPGCE